MAQSLATLLAAEIGQLEVRRFPDGETYLKVRSPVAGCHAVLVCSLNDPDRKTLPLIFAAKTLKELGAESVGLVAPYLAYMRQDKRFQAGEAITSRVYAELLSDCADWLVTIDPHLHRYASLHEIYRIKTAVGTAIPLFAGFVRSLGEIAFLIGPDEESEQWVSELARGAECQYVVLGKERHGDRDVDLSFGHLSPFRGFQPVIVDDIISSGVTMEKIVRHLLAEGFKPPICLAVHGVFSGDTRERLEQSGATIITTNSIENAFSRLDVTPILAALIMYMATPSSGRAKS